MLDIADGVFKAIKGCEDQENNNKLTPRERYLIEYGYTQAVLDVAWNTHIGESFFVDLTK